MPTDTLIFPGRRGSVVPFFLLAFAITWLVQLPAVFAKQGLLRGDPGSYIPFAVFGVFGPLVAATVLTAREGGRSAVRELYSGLRQWRAPVETYVVALVAPAVALTGILWLLRLAGREGPIAYVPDGGRVVAAFVIALGEEVGWRGYALPRLQKSVGRFAASGVIGVLWTVWHIPMFVGMGIPLSFLLVMGLFFTGGSFVFTWIYQRSGGSLFLAVLAHVGGHLNNSHVALPADAIPVVVHAIVYAGLGLALLRPTAAALSHSRSAHELP